MSSILPNPGSQAAVLEGCTCPILDNFYGRGMPMKDNNGHDVTLQFWIDSECPLHGVGAGRKVRESGEFAV